MEPERSQSQQEETPETVDFLLNLQEVRRIQKFLPKGVFLQVVKNSSRNRKTRVSNLTKKQPELIQAPRQKRRAYTEAERTIRGTSELFNKCQRIVDILKKDEDIEPFMEPVDPVELDIPDYFDIIKNPMDIGTIERNLRDHKYETPEEFNKEMRLVWSNCMTYNPEESDIYKMAKEFSDKFEALLQTDLDKRKARVQVPIMKDKVEDRVVDSEANRPVKTDESVNKMTYQEKKTLSDMIRKLPQDYLWGVWEIVSKGDNEKQNEELEFDIETLSTETARKLEKYVQGMIEKLNERQKQANNNDEKPEFVTNPNLVNNSPLDIPQDQENKPDLDARQRFDLEKPNSEGDGNARSNFGEVDGIDGDLSNSPMMSGLS